MSTNIRKLDISKTVVEDVPASIAMWFSLYVEQWKAQGDNTPSPECTLHGSLNNLRADDCESLESVFFHMKDTPDAFHQQLQTEPTSTGRNYHRIVAPRKRSLTMKRSDCRVPSPPSKRKLIDHSSFCFLHMTCMYLYIGNDVSKYRAGHLFIFHSHLLDEFINPAKVRTQITFELSSPSSVFNITECGAKICTQQTIEGSYESGSEHLDTQNNF
ncbi:LOW QUALITY PROTEIN: hypothetical protein YC2023_051720 [Brassica napus]